MKKDHKNFADALSVFLCKYFESDSDTGLPETDKVKDGIPLAKSVDTELMQATFLVLAPDEVDLHGDTYSADTIRDACHNFNVHCRKANLLHATDTELAEIVESYVTMTDIYLDDKLIKKGSWLQVYQFRDQDLWDLVKSGQINGVSVGCNGLVEELDD